LLFIQTSPSLKKYLKTKSSFLKVCNVCPKAVNKMKKETTNKYYIYQKFTGTTYII